MPQYLKLAEKIYTEVKSTKDFTDQPLEDLNNLMLELRSAIKNTDFKLVYNYIDFEQLLMKSEQGSINLDISILPKSKHKDEYILWLAGFIEKITINEKLQQNVTSQKIVLPAYYIDDKGNIVNESKSSAEEIISYFEHKDISL